MSSAPLPQRGDATRDVLISAAVDVFARDGFHAARTRAIADAAGVNQALIGYHFGGKEALYLAVFEHIAGQIGQRLGPTIDALQQALAQPQSADAKPGTRREQDFDLLLRLLDRVAAIMNEQSSAAWAQLILREQQMPTAAFNLLYERVMGRLLDTLTKLLHRLKGEAADVRLLAATIVGQALVFRAARAAVLRYTGWPDLGPDELRAIQAQIRSNLTALLSNRE